MYLRQVKVVAARALAEASLTFDQGREAGWHVVIGPNGTGKSTLLRAIVIALIGERDVEASLIDLTRWIRPGEVLPRIDVVVTDGSPPDATTLEATEHRTHSWSVEISGTASGRSYVAQVTRGKRSPKPWEQERGWFSAAYGPFRRLSGGDSTFDIPRFRETRLGAHMSALQDGYALSEAESWLVELTMEELEATKTLAAVLEGSDFANGLVLAANPTDSSDAGDGNVSDRDRDILTRLDIQLWRLEREINRSMRFGRIKAVVGPWADENAQQPASDTVSSDMQVTIRSLHDRIVQFFNASEFLFEGLKIVSIGGGRIEVSDSTGLIMDLSQLSDGYRAIIAVGLETIRLMLACYGPETVLQHMDLATGVVALPGIILIDEVETHLHPPWQEGIGSWLRRRFPLVQFIVTTHSPIVCRSVAVAGRIEGSVWELGRTGLEGPSVRRIEGQRLNRLVFGDLVEAVGTEAFGTHVAQSDEAGSMLKRMAELNRRALRGPLPPAESNELATLRATFPARSSDTADLA